MNRTEELLKIMAERQLSYQDVMELTGAAHNTVRLWRVKTNGRHIPAAKLELLKLKLGVV